MGEKKGKQKQQREVIRNMLIKGFSIETIMELVNVSKNMVLHCQEELKNSN